MKQIRLVDSRSGCYWLQSAGLDSASTSRPLEGSLDADILIVGGGFTGLSAALHLSETFPERQIVLLEGARVGYGASGRNDGLVLPFINGADAVVKQLLEAKRTEQAKRVYEATSAGIEIIERLATSGKIDCDWERVDCLRTVLTVRQEALLDGDRAMYAALGVDTEWVPPAELHPRTEDGRFRGALRIRAGGMIHPGKLVRGLLDLVRASGVRVFEESPVRQIKTGSTIIAKTAKAEVRAATLVLATNAYSAQLGFFRRRILPVHSYSIATAPLSEERIETLKWQGRESVLDVRNFFEVFRLTKDNRIILSGGDAFYQLGGSTSDRRDHPVYGRLEQSLRALFPTLSDIPVTHRWVGHVGLTLDRVPTIGALGTNPNAFFAGGYSGHGVSAAVLAGRLLCDLCSGKSLGPEFEFLRDRRLFSTPPEPLTRVGFGLYKRYLRWADSR